MNETLKDRDFEASALLPVVLPRSVQEVDLEDTGNSQAPCENRSQSLSSSEIAVLLNTDRRNITNWYPVIRQAFCWLEESDLKIGIGKNTRYTPFCLEQMTALMAATAEGRSYDDWTASIRQNYAEAYENWLQVQPIQPDRTTSEALFPAESGNTSSESAMIPYQAASGEMERFTPPTRKIFKYTSTQSFVQDATQQTEEGLETTQSNSSALTDALINQMTEEGRKLGVTLFQAKYGTAHAVLADLEEALAKKSGLVSDSASPPSGSAA